MTKELKKLLANPIITKLLVVFGQEADLHVVGGAVRDALLNREADDIDLATRLTPDQVIEKLDDACLPWIPTGIRRGTITALIRTVPVEITTFRDYNNENTFTETIEEDLIARDFTINAIALSVNDGEIKDPFNGVGDLKTKTLRSVGNPLFRFAEDPHRILRFVRFTHQLGFTPDLSTEEGAKKLVESLNIVSVERIKKEFVKILLCDNPANALNHLLELGALKFVVPELLDCVGFEQNSHHIFDVWGHTLEVVSNVPPVKELRLAALFHDIAKPRCLSVDDGGNRHFLGHEDIGSDLAKEIMKRLKFSKADVDVVTTLVKEHMRPTIEGGPKSIRRTIKKVGKELFPFWLILKEADRTKGGHVLNDDFSDKWKEFLTMVSEVTDKIEQHSHGLTLAIGGKDLLSLGLKPGPTVGEVLKKLEDLILDCPEKNNKQELIEEAKEIIKNL